MFEIKKMLSSCLTLGGDVISYLNFVVVACLLLNVADGSVRAAMPAVTAASCPGVRAASVNVRRVVGLATGLIPRIHQSYSVYSIRNRVLNL